MTATGKITMAILGVVALALLAPMALRYGGLGYFSAPQALVMLIGLWPLALIGALVVFGVRIVERLDRIEQAIAQRDSAEMTSHGA